MTNELLNDITHNVKKGARIVAGYGKNAVKTAALSGNKFNLENGRDKLIYELGGMFYEMMQKDAMDVDALKAHCAKIMELDDALGAVTREAEEYEN